jgi:hypothetical protein
VSIVIVGGPHSGVGKTLASELAIRTLRSARVGAIKLTVADGERDPVHDHGASALAVADAAGVCGRGASCGVCETVSTRIPSRLITSAGAIARPGTDTYRLLNAGAVSVAWVIALRSGAPSAVENAMEYLKRAGANLFVIEGTTALEWISPAASVMVATDPAKKWKDVALRYVGTCDIVLQNILASPSGSAPVPAQFWSASPLRCNLSDLSDTGTKRYMERLASLVAARNCGQISGARAR